MFTDRLDGSRFFARILGFELACPLCGHVYRINLLTRTSTYNQRTGIFSCGTCHLTAGVGLLLYPLHRPPRIAQGRTGRVSSTNSPEDWSPNLREALALRNFIAWGVYSPHHIHRAAARNYCLRHGCTCDLSKIPTLDVDPACPVHAGPSVDEGVPEPAGDPAPTTPAPRSGGPAKMP